MAIERYQDLEVWKKAMDLCEKIYRVTAEFPNQERYGLVSQMRRAVVSLPSNIAEGFVRRHRKEFKQFLSIATSSLAELETQVMLAKRFDYLVDTQVKEILEDTGYLGRMLTKLYQRIIT